MPHLGRIFVRSLLALATVVSSLTALVALSANAATSPSVAGAVTSAHWSRNVRATVGSYGTWTYRSNGLPAYGMVKYYAVPTAQSSAIPTSSTSRVAPTSSIEKVQHYKFTLPLRPTYAATSTPTGRGPIGVTVNGALLFNSFEGDGTTVALASNFSTTANGITAPFLDACSGHFAPSGQYHYHGLPRCIVTHLKGGTRAAGGSGRPTLIGFLFDGFPVYDNVAMNGSTISKRQLDSCNGLYSATPQFPKGIYHYVLLSAATKYSSINCYHGVVASSYTQRPMNTLGGPENIPLAK